MKQTRFPSAFALIVILMLTAGSSSAEAGGPDASEDGSSLGDLAQTEEGGMAEEAGMAEEVQVAEEVEPAVPMAESRKVLGDIVIGIHIAPLLPVFSDLDVFVLPRLELGYNLPFWGRRIEPFFSIAYTAPTSDDQLPDTRLPTAGNFTYDIRQKQLMLGIGAYLRIFELGATINPYVGFGPVLYLLETVATGESGGEPFGENTAQGTKVGIYGAFGVELVLGPGAGFFEIGITWSDLDNFITGDSNTGALAPTLGYRFMF